MKIIIDNFEISILAHQSGIAEATVVNIASNVPTHNEFVGHTERFS